MNQFQNTTRLGSFRPYDTKKINTYSKKNYISLDHSKSTQDIQIKMTLHALEYTSAKTKDNKPRKTLNFKCLPCNYFRIRVT